MAHRLLPRAERDLASIYEYTFLNFGEAQADKYLLELERVFELIADFPSIGPTFSGATRRFVYGKHIILYRVEGKDVLIGRVVHGAQRG